MLFDSHCHLTDPQFDADRDAVIARALAAGVTRMLTLATDVESSRAAIRLAEQHPSVWAAIGIHPEAVQRAELGELEQLRELAKHPRVAAIGEIGLDYYWDKTTAPRQQAFFEAQLELAAELGLPVAIHDRDAHDAVLETLVKFGEKGPRGVLHAFSGSIEMANAAFAVGYVVSFGGPVTFLNNKQAPNVIGSLSLEQMLIETDSPYLAPHPLRGKRNEPSNVGRIAARIAELRGLDVEQVANQTTSNALGLFGRIAGERE